MSLISPSEVASDPGIYLADIRPRPERDRGIGFIAGSVGIDPLLDPAEMRQTLAGFAEDRRTVLVCMSGNRAQTLASSLDMNAACLVLAGGVLEWSARGLPLAGRRDASPPPQGEPLPLRLFTRQLTACFVGELADAAIDRDLNPVEVLEQCCRRAAVNPEAPTESGLRRLIDHAAAFSRTIGTPLERVAQNVDSMLLMLGHCSRGFPDADLA